MRYLVDANVLSEATRRAPSRPVVEWLQAHEPDLAVDAIVLAELAAGVASLPSGRKRSRLEAWFDALADTIECLPWTAETARAWAVMVAEMRRRGRVMPLFDSMIAASARAHGLTVITRNVHDFEAAGVDVFDPFPPDRPVDRVHEPEPSR